MRLQYVTFIESGTGATVSANVENLLDGNVLCLLALSDTAPDLTVEIHTGRDPENGEWLPGTVFGVDMTEQSGIDANGFYYIPTGGVQYIRIKSASADTSLAVVGAFFNTPEWGYSTVFKADEIIETETRVSENENGYIEWVRSADDEYVGSELDVDDEGNLVQTYDDSFDYIPADLSMSDGDLSATATH